MESRQCLTWLSMEEYALPLKAIAERQEISEAYLEQLIASLRKAGLVKV